MFFRNKLSLIIKGGDKLYDANWQKWSNKLRYEELNES